MTENTMTESTMTENNIYSAYDAFARVMSEDWGPRCVKAKLPNVKKLLLKHIPQNSSILDICCGTGELAENLQNQGYQVTGLDGSSELLHYARIKAPQSKFILEDARYFKLPASFNGVICTNFGFNHITELEDLTLTFKNVYEALLPGGLFVFDLRLDECYRGSWNGDILGDASDEQGWTLIRFYNQETKIGNIYITIYNPVDNSWKRSELNWFVKGYGLQEVTSALKEAGFTDINHYQAGTGMLFNRLSGKAGEYYFVTKK